MLRALGPLRFGTYRCFIKKLRFGRVHVLLVARALLACGDDSGMDASVPDGASSDASRGDVPSADAGSDVPPPRTWKAAAFASCCTRARARTRMDASIPIDGPLVAALSVVGA